MELLCHLIYLKMPIKGRLIKTEVIYVAVGQRHFNFTDSEIYWEALKNIEGHFVWDVMLERNMERCVCCYSLIVPHNLFESI